MTVQIGTQSEKDDMYQAAGQILALAMRINTEKDVSVFVDFSGHVNHIEVTICKSKSDYLTNLARMIARTDDTALQNRDKLETVIDLLTEIVDFDTSDTNALRIFCEQHPATDQAY